MKHSCGFWVADEDDGIIEFESKAAKMVEQRRDFNMNWTFRIRIRPLSRKIKIWNQESWLLTVGDYRIEFFNFFL